MDAPTAADVRAWSPPQLDWSTYGYPAPTPPDADPLERPVAWSVAYVVSTTGRDLATIDDVDASFPSLVEQAVVLRTIQQVAGGGRAALEALLDAPWIKSFSAGSYSETRFSPTELAATKLVNPLPALADLLWLLMTEDKRDEFLERSGQRVRPAAGFAPGFPGSHVDRGELAAWPDGGW